MEMTKEAMEYLVELSAPQVVDVFGDIYSKDKLNRISFIPKAEALKLHTLTSLVEYIKSKTDGMDPAMLVHVESPTKVLLYSCLDKDRGRECLVEVNAELPYIGFNKYVDQEEFLIGMQANFLPTDDRNLILKFAGTVEDKSVAEYGDDGVTQKATIRKGVSSKTDAVVPNPVSLKPYRTFFEVDQPESKFIFRMSSDCGIACAIYEADGGKWKSEAMNNVKEYLKKELDGIEGFTVIS